MTGVADLAPSRWAWAQIHLDAIDHNIGLLRRTVDPAAVWAVVKADGYGHGSVAVARQAVRSGAEGLCVALVSEGVELRRAGIDAPILVLSEQPIDQIATLVQHRLIPTVYSSGSLEAVAAVGEPGIPVHIKVDTGMQRVGAPAASAVGLVHRALELAPRVRLAGVYTHLACADDPASSANGVQLAAFDAVLAELDAEGVRPPMVHAANSAAALALPSARFDLTRIGIAMYGISPGPGVDDLSSGLRPAMSLHARVSHLKPVRAGSRVSYGWRHRFEHDTRVATVPIGYADGVPRRLGTLSDRPGSDVLIGGRRHPIVGVVTMDQLMVDVGDADVSVGDEVVLIGEQGEQRIRAVDWAERLGTIGYEIVCGVSTRVPRVVRGAT